MNRKGNFPDVLEWIGVALILGITITMTLLFINNWDSQVQSTDSSVIPDNVKAGVTELKTSVTSGFDYLFVFLFVIFVGFSVIAARLIPSSPKLVFIAFFAFILLIAAAWIIEEVWYGFNSNTTISAVTSNLVFIPFFLDKLMFFALGYAFVIGVALYTKEDTGGSFFND